MKSKQQPKEKFHIVKISVDLPNYEFYADELNKNLKNVIEFYWVHEALKQIEPQTSIDRAAAVDDVHYQNILSVVRCNLLDDHIECIGIMYDIIRVFMRYPRNPNDPDILCHRVDEYAASRLFEIGKFIVNYRMNKLFKGRENVNVALQISHLETIEATPKAAREYAIHYYGFTDAETVRQTFKDILWRRGEKTRNQDAEMRQLCHDRTFIANAWFVIKRNPVKRLDMKMLISNLVAICRRKEEADELCEKLNAHYKGRAKYYIMEVKL